MAWCQFGEGIIKMGKDELSQDVQIVDTHDEDIFKDRVNALRERGYEISSTACGFTNSEDYDFCARYQAILVKG